MTHRERVLTVLSGGIPDKIARGDIMFHPKIMDEALGLKAKDDYGNALAAWMYENMSEEEFIKQKSFRDFIQCDLIAVFPTFTLTEMENIGDKMTHRDIFGNLITVYQNETEITHVIKTPDDLLSYRYPEISEFRVQQYKTLVESI